MMIASSACMTSVPVLHTDPARELADLCTALSGHSDAAGDDYLASKFQVKAWSSEFYQIVACIVERGDYLIKIVNALDMDEDVKDDAIVHITMVQAAFAKGALLNSWSAQGCGASLLSGSNIQPIKMLSPTVRNIVSYPKPSAEDIQAILEDTAEFKDWLEQHQVAEQDFIRQIMLDGLSQFRFRLSKIQWLGWGYTFSSLREIIAAYKILETTLEIPLINPDAEAVLKKGISFFVKVFSKVGVAKETVERADFLLKMYGTFSLVQQGASVAGLLTHVSS
jgi:hypothetical protein